MLALALVVLSQLPPGHPEIPADHPPVGPAKPSATAAMPPGHPAVESGKPAPSMDELVKKLDGMKDLKDKDKTFEVAVSLGKIYLSHSKYELAATFFDQAVKKGEPLRAWVLSHRAKAPANLPPCTWPADTPLEKTPPLLAKEKNAALALACATRTLPALTAAETELGNALFLSGDVEGALKAHERALVTDPTNLDSQYAHAALLLEARGDAVPSLEQAKKELTGFIAHAGDSPKLPQARAFLARAEKGIAAGGLSKIAPQPAALSRPPPAPMANGPAAPAPLAPEVVDAFNKVERTPELAKNLAGFLDEGEKFLAQQKFQDALDSYKKVMPLEPNNPRVRAGMAWSLVGLNRQPMADRVWGVASSNPEAIDALGDALLKQGDAAGAKAVWTKLKETVPSYGARLEAKLK